MRQLAVICGMVTLLVLGIGAWALYGSTRELELRPPRGMVDRLVMLDTAERFSSGKSDRIETSSETPPRLVLKDKAEDFPRRGTWTSAEVQSEFPFTELIPSWNVIAPADTGVRFHVRVRDVSSRQWSPWLYMGQWGRTLELGKDDKITRFPLGEVQIDTLLLRRDADAFQVRATLQSFNYDLQVSPAIRRIAVSYSGYVPDEIRREQLAPQKQFTGEWAKDLGVPFRPQSDAPKPLWSEICSPTSTSMVMEYCGVSIPTTDNALAIYDPEYGLFGNWNRAVARAGSLGLDAWLTRFRNFDQVRASIAAGQPIIASIRFGRDANIQSFLYKETAGHLIVIRGFTRAGDVIVNDPASRSKGNGVVYKADELAKAWFDNGGVGYVIRKGDSRLMVSHSAKEGERNEGTTDKQR